MKKKKIEESKFQKVLNVIIYILAIIGAMNLIIYIFVGSKGLMNSDSSFVVDYSLEQIRTHSIFPKNWVNTNDFWVYSLIPFITPFLKLGFGLFTARQLSVLVQTIIMFAILIDLVKKQIAIKGGVKYVLLLFASGISGQFMFEIFGDATYGSITLYMLLELWLFIRYMKTEKKINAIIYTIILILITACSLRFPIYIGAPIICCLLYMIYDNVKNKKAITMLIITIVGILIGYLLNKYLQNHYILLASTDRNILGGADELSNALHNTAFNYLWVCGSTNINVFSLTITFQNNLITTTSPLILISFIRFIYAIITIALPFVLIKKFKEMEESEKILYIYTVSLTLIILFFLIIGGMWNWYRYISPVLFFLNLLYIIVYRIYFSNSNRNKTVFKATIILFAISSLFLTFTSWYDIENKHIVKNKSQGMTDFLVSKKLKFGYYDGPTEHGIYRVLSNDKVQVTRLIGYRQFHWLNSKDWYSTDYYNGKTFYIRNKDAESLEFEKKAIKKYKYNDDIIFVFKKHSDILEYLD